MIADAPRQGKPAADARALIRANDRSGVSQAAIARRVHTHHWYRINDRGSGGAKLNDALIDMAMDVKQAVRSLMTRGRRLMARALKEADGLKAETEAHREQIETFDRLVRMIERLSAMLERAGKNAGGQHGGRLRDRAPELKRRLAKLADARSAGSDHPGAGAAAGR